MNKPALRTLLFGALLFLLALCLDPVPVLPASAAAESEGECVIEVCSRRILHEKNAADCLPMASTTKIMTAILLLDDCALGETVVIPREAQGVEGSSVYLKAGEEYTVEELLYGLMLRSGNDCAVALALHHSGSVEAFARKMNEKAALLGAQDTHFVNPHGLPAKGHYTTARDLAILSSYAMQNPVFEKIVSTKYYAAHNWQNKNKMLRDYEGAIGVKTGFTVQAGRCLVTCAMRNGMKLVCAVLNSPQMYERTAELLDAAFGEYHMERLVDRDSPVGGFSVRESFSYPLKEGEKPQITLDAFPQPSARSGDFAGTLKISLQNSLIFCTDLYIM